MMKRVTDLTMIRFCQQRGFTLVEMMVAVAILVIVMSIAAPSFNAMINRQQLQAKVSLLTSTLAYARNEAVSRVGTVVLCGTSDGLTCNGTSNLSGGWLVFVDKNSDGAFSVLNGDELLKQGGDGSSKIRLSLAASATNISFSDQGESSNVRNIYMCTTGEESDPAKARTVTVSIVGSTRVSTGATCTQS